MAKIKQGILGGFSGSVAGVVGTSWKGRAIMKAKPLSVSNPKTEGQVSQRTSFKTVAILASSLLTEICRPVYNPIAGDISGYNKFTSQNKEMFDGTGAFVPAKAFIGGGTLSHDPITDATIVGTQEFLKLDWVNSAVTGSPRRQDDVKLYAFEPISGTVWIGTGEGIRQDGEKICAKFKGGSDLMGQLQVYCFVAYVSEDGRQVSTEAAPTAIEIDFSA